MKVNAAYLRSLRKERGYTIRDFAKKAGISPAYLSQIENNQKTPSLKVLQKLAQALNLGKEELISLTEPTPGIPLGKKLQALRTSKGFTLENLAHLTKFSASYLAHIEAGLVLPSFSVISRLAEVLEVTPSALFAAEKNTIGHKLKALRLEKQLTLEELASSAGVSSGLLWQIEQGSTQPSLQTIKKLSAVLGNDACLFLLQDDEPQAEASLLDDKTTEMLQNPQVIKLLETLQGMDNKELQVITEMILLFKNSRS